MLKRGVVHADKKIINTNGNDHDRTAGINDRKTGGNGDMSILESGSEEATDRYRLTSPQLPLRLPATFPRAFVQDGVHARHTTK